MSVIGAAAGIAGLVTALNVGAATVKNVAGAAKEAGEVLNNAYEGAKKVARDIKSVTSGTTEPELNGNKRPRKSYNYTRKGGNK